MQCRQGLSSQHLSSYLDLAVLYSIFVNRGLRDNAVLCSDSLTTVINDGLYRHWILQKWGQTCFLLCFSSSDLSPLLYMGLKGEKMWTRFQNIQIYSKIERNRGFYLLSTNSHNWEEKAGWFNLGAATNLLRFLSFFKAHCCTKCIWCGPQKKMPKIGNKT